jgi:hypothetical protein
MAVDPCPISAATRRRYRPHPPAPPSHHVADSCLSPEPGGVGQARRAEKSVARRRSPVCHRLVRRLRAPARRVRSFSLRSTPESPGDREATEAAARARPQ